MAKGVRISDNLYRLAQLEAVLENRSIAQQIEYWAKRGMGSARAVSGERADYGASVDAALEATRRLDILDVECGARKAEDLHFVPAAVARESVVIGPRKYRKSPDG
jgi:hypothetical protein